MKALGEFLRPEFIGRVDEVVFFQPLSRETYTKIAGLMLEELVEPLRERGITLTYTDAACQALAEQATGGKRGARDLRNAIRRQVENRLAEEVVARCGDPFTAVTVDAVDGEIRLDYAG